MRILAFSDLHHAPRAAREIVAASDGADLVIGAGDYCNMRQDLEGALALLGGIRAPMVLVPGNAESAEELRAAAPAGVHVLHGDGVEIGGLRIFGIGGAIPETPFGDWSFDLGEDAARGLLAGCDAADILICHAPPKGIADRTSAGMSVGSAAVLEAIERVQPGLAVCGHIHDSWGVRGRVGETEVVNLGPTANWFEMGEGR